LSALGCFIERPWRINSVSTAGKKVNPAIMQVAVPVAMTAAKAAAIGANFHVLFVILTFLCGTEG